MLYGIWKRELIICSDGIDEIVNAFNVDILDNDPNNCINVLHIDWNDLQ